jgi:hypothetical protein
VLSAISVLFFWPLAIAALISSARSAAALKDNNIPLARAKAKSATIFASLAIVIGLLVTVVVLIPVAATHTITNAELKSDQASALNIATAAYFTAQSMLPTAHVTVGSLSPSASSTTLNGQLLSNGQSKEMRITTGSRAGTARFAFPDGNVVCIAIATAPALTTGC